MGPERDRRMDTSGAWAMAQGYASSVSLVGLIKPWDTSRPWEALDRTRLINGFRDHCSRGWLNDQQKERSDEARATHVFLYSLLLVGAWWSKTGLAFEVETAVEQADVGVTHARAGLSVSAGDALAMGNGTTRPSAGRIDGTSVPLASSAVGGERPPHQRTDIAGQQGPVMPVTSLSAPPPPTRVSSDAPAVVVAAKATTQLRPGRYASVLVKRNATLRLSGGIYVVASLTLESQARLEALAPAELRIAGRIAAADKTFIGPSRSAGVDLNLTVEVSGQNGATGTRGDAPKAAVFGARSTVQAIVRVLNGTLQLGEKSRATGVFQTRDIDVGPPVRVRRFSPLLDDNPCTLAACTVVHSPGGPIICVEPPAPDGSSCSDGNACTTGDVCASGTCVGRGIAFSDTNPCTADACDPVTGNMTHVPVTAGTSCSDGEFCNGLEQCDSAGACVTVADTVPLPGTACNDDNLCNGFETCQGGACQANSLPAGTSCSDGNACNGVELCDGAGSCLVAALPANGTPCSDGDPCTGTDTCQGGACVGAPLTDVLCSDGNPCTRDLCQSGVCVGTASNTASCDDGDACNGTEVCVSGACQHANAPQIDDGNNATIDVCDATTGYVGHSICSEPFDLSVVTTTAAAAKCLYVGASPIQVDIPGQPFPVDLDPVSATCQGGTCVGTPLTGVRCVDGNPCTSAAPFHPSRVAIVRGKVTDTSGVAIAGATVRVLGKPSFGRTATGASGEFELAVEGGAALTLQYEHPGYLPVLRTVQLPVQLYGHAPPVTLTALDTAVTAIDLDEPSTIQVARASLQVDNDGIRQATLLFAPGTTATIVTSDGTGGTQETPLSGPIHVRATEYTVGPAGPTAMPLQLPPASGYTYAAELSIDKVPPGADVQFGADTPVLVYVENFVGFPVGETVPSGFLDRAHAVWVPSANGRVIRIDDVVQEHGAPAALVDSVGATGNEALVLALPERQQLASLYAKGQTLWRIPVTHFTAWDWNWGFGPPPDAFFPGEPDPDANAPLDEQCETGGSTIECQGQILGESIPIVGTPFRLHYQSDRVPGRVVELKIPLIGSKTHPQMKRIELSVHWAGVQVICTFSPQPNQTVTIPWDVYKSNCSFSPQPDQTATMPWYGYKAKGQLTQGAQPVTATIVYVYAGVYRSTTNFGTAAIQGSGSGSPGGQILLPGAAIGGDREAFEVRLPRVWHGHIGHWNAVHRGLGGWELDVRHAYDPVGKVLYLGDGRRRSARDVGGVLAVTAGAGPNAACPTTNVSALGAKMLPQKVKVAPDGSLYIVDWCNIVWHLVDGTLHLLTGGQGTDFQPYDVEVAPDGTVFVADGPHHVIYRVDPATGSKTIIAGAVGEQCVYSTSQPCGDGKSAASARLNFPDGLALGPDGSLYVSDGGNLRIRRIDPAGTITTFAGSGVECGAQVDCGEEGPADQAKLGKLGWGNGLDVGPDGTLYIAESGANRVRAVTPDGIMHRVAGTVYTGLPDFQGEGKPANDDQTRLLAPQDVAVGLDGKLYVATNLTGSSPGTKQRGRVVQVSPPLIAGPGEPNGILETVAGGHFASDCAEYCVGSSGCGRQCREGFRATTARLESPRGVDVGPDGTLYIADHSGFGVYSVAPAFPGLSFTDIVIPSADATELYFFDKLGRHLKTRDALTGKVLYHFDMIDIDGVIDADDRATLIQREGGEPTGILSPFGQLTTLKTWPVPHGQHGYLKSVTNPANETIQLDYYSGPFHGLPLTVTDGLLHTVTDPKGHVTTYEYDDRGQLIKETYPPSTLGERTLTRAETSTGYTVAFIEANGHQPTGDVTSYGVEVDAMGSRHEVTTLPGGNKITSIVDLAGVLDPAGARKTTYPDGTTVTQVECPDPRFQMQAPLVASFSLQTGSGADLRTLNVTTQRTVTLANPDDIFSLQTLTDTVTTNGRETTTFKAAAQQVDGTWSKPTVTHTTNAKRTRTMELDADGRATKVSVTSSAIPLTPTLLSYYPSGLHKGRLWTITRGTGPDTRTYEFFYDPQGNLQSVTGPLTKTTSFDYDLAGRIQQVTRPDGEMTGFTYDLNGNVETLAPPGTPLDAPLSQKHQFTYNAVDALHTYVPPDLLSVANETTTLDYTPDRQLDLVTRPDAATVDPSYDSLGRLESVATADNTIGYPYFPFADPEAGKLQQITTSSQTNSQDNVSLAYAYTGSLLKKTSWSGAITGEVERTYDNDFRIATEAVNGQSVSWAYNDPDGLLTQAGALTVVPDPDTGLIVGTQLDNLTDSFGYNPFGELVTYVVTFQNVQNGGPSVTKYSLAYDRDALGRVWRKTEAIEGTPAVVTEYGYDAAGRLADVYQGTAPCDQPASGCVHVGHYAYDANGNRTLFQGASGPAVIGTPDAQDRLMSYGAVTFKYTDHGELLTRTESGQSTGYVYDYDVFGNLRSVTPPSGPAIEYVIDGQQRRVGKKVGGTLVQGLLYRNGLAPVAELDGAGNLVSRFVYGTRAHVPDYLVKGSNTLRLVTDQLGSVRLVIDAASGAIMQRLDYDAFGRVLDTSTNLCGDPGTTGCVGLQPFGFAGGLYDVATGLVRFRARDYDAEIGRWTTKDPILFRGGDTNLYGYAMSDPVNRNDPQGTGPYTFFGCIFSGRPLLSCALEEAVSISHGPLGDNAWAPPGGLAGGPPFVPQVLYPECHIVPTSQIRGCCRNATGYRGEYTGGDEMCVDTESMDPEELSKFLRFTICMAESFNAHGF
jgi:RHS repeat-associated protein